MSDVAEKLGLDTPYDLTDAHIKQFQEDGFVLLKGVLSREAIEHYRDELNDLTMAHNAQADVPLEKRTTYGKAFIQVGNLWTKSENVQPFILNEKLARIAAELMGTDGSRMWHDQSLYKEPGGGYTPWHADQQYWPMGSAMCCTAWIPLQDTPIEMGPMCFGKGTHLKNMGRELEISDESEAKIRQMVKDQGIVEIQEPYELGDVSYHWGWTLHRAGPNTTDKPRRVQTVIYMDEQMRLARPKNQNQKNDWEHWTPSTQVGEVMDDDLNPVLWSSDWEEDEG